jgi:hypothetical protein
VTLLTLILSGFYLDSVKTVFGKCLGGRLASQEVCEPVNFWKQ